jgi:hypothetical protein
LGERLSSILLVASMVLSAGCNDASLRSVLVSSPPRIDGELAEWQTIPVTLFDEKKVAIGAMNDGQFLYVAGRCAEPELTRSIQRSGLTLWIDPDGNKNKDLELRYPASGDSQPDQTRGGFWQVMTDEQRAKASGKLDQMNRGVLVIDKHAIASRRFPSDSTDGFAAAIAESNGILFFEIRIPFHIEQYFPGRPALTDRQSVSIGLGAAGSSRRGQNLNSASGRTPFGQSGGMMGSGRRRGASRGSFDESDVWVEVAIARPS